MKVDINTQIFGPMSHDIELGDTKSFSSSVFYYEAMKSWYWCVGTCVGRNHESAKMIATGPAHSEAEAKRRALHFLAAAKALLADS